VFLFVGLFLLVSFASYQPLDSSLNTASFPAKPANLTGHAGAYLSDFFLQSLGLGAYAIPALILLLGWKWIQSAAIHAPFARALGAAMMLAATCSMLGFASAWHPVAGMIPAGGLAGLLLADELIASINLTGAWMLCITCWILGLYLVSTFEVAILQSWLASLIAKPVALFRNISDRLHGWRERRAVEAKARADKREFKKAMQARDSEAKAARAAERAKLAEQNPHMEEPRPSIWQKALGTKAAAAAAGASAVGSSASLAEVHAPEAEALRGNAFDAPPFEPTNSALQAAPEEIPIDDIPIRVLEYVALEASSDPIAELLTTQTGPTAAETARAVRAGRNAANRKSGSGFKLPPTDLLNPAEERSEFDSEELRQTAAQIKSKFEEFNVRGSVTQINPGPVVTTFEFKPEAGVKVSRITTLREDLCLGLQAESILIERIPGKPTVGIEVPNARREVISLRQILESEEFTSSASPLTVALGKDINGRIKVAALDSMPHLLIAGSTGAGKSVMLNSLIMSILYKATPQQVRLIMVDPKRLEFGLYEGIPHLLTPVITDPKKATNALRNAVLEMERRLKLLASQGVRNIDQYNKKVRQLQAQPRSLFEEDDPNEEPLEQIPYVLILIDELADLMMLERANVEESVTRLAQMARAVGMHLVLATQRPSVDVITGLIKANFPSRISFRVATRVDSRTVLDVMGAEHLLGKGDMLFLPPGSSRLVRVHGSYVSESETNSVVSFWKQQAEPEYDQSFLIAPPTDEDLEAEEFDGPEDPVYQDAVRVVCEMGKASTSTLQRRLRLGYGRAARILDMMQREGIIGPPDGSRPREVLKHPDWLREVENQLG